MKRGEVSVYFHCEQRVSGVVIAVNELSSVAPVTRDLVFLYKMDTFWLLTLDSVHVQMTENLTLAFMKAGFILATDRARYVLSLVRPSVTWMDQS